MVRIISIFAFALICRVACALPVANPYEPAFLCNSSGFPIFDSFGLSCNDLSLRVGFYYDHVFNRHLELDEPNRSPAIVEVTKIDTVAATIVLNFCDWFDAFVDIGQSTINIATSANGITPITENNAEPFYLKTEGDLSWTLGARVAPFAYRGFGVGAEARYFFYNTRVDWFRSFDTDTSYPNVKVKYEEAQFSLGVSYNAGWMIPFVAGKVAWARLNEGDAVVFAPGVLPQTITYPNYKNQKTFGYVVGFSLVPCNSINLQVEWRFVDEKAILVFSEIRF